MTATPTQSPPSVTREPPPRRNWLLLSVVAVLLIAVAGGVGWWIGSSGSEDTADVAGEMPEILEGFYDALLEGDSTAMAALFTEDGGLTGPTEEQIRSNLSPPATIRRNMAAWFSYVDYTEIAHMEVITDANTVAVVSRMEGMSATHQRSSKTPFSAQVVDVFEIRDGLIAQCDVYLEYDEIVT